MKFDRNLVYYSNRLIILTIFRKVCLIEIRTPDNGYTINYKMNVRLKNFFISILMRCFIINYYFLNNNCEDYDKKK